jgi:molybdate transport system ATP-binding protein
VSDSLPEILHVHVIRRVHPGLVIDVAFRLGREIGVVFGPSGAGKSTLLRLIAGLTTPDSGTIRLDDTTIFEGDRRVNQPLRLRRIGMIFQEDWLFPHLTVAANIRFGLKSWASPLAQARLDQVAALCGVEHLLNRRPDTLSGGERQRVGLARALAPRPKLLLCDEPVSALDLANRHALLNRLRTVQREEGIPMLYVTHSPAEAIALGSRLFLLEQGRIVTEGLPLDVLGTAGTASRRSIASEGIKNVFPAHVASHAPEHGASIVCLESGPRLVVPFLDTLPGTRVLIEIGADDIILTRQPVGALSARNQIPGTVERIVSHGPDAEAVIRTDGLTWIVSLVAPAVGQLEIGPGSTIHMIVKARSCRVVEL